MTVCFLITTYNRQESCQRLVDSLQGLGDIVVINDGCSYNINGCIQLFQQTHYGKKGYWRTVNALFRHRVRSGYYIMLPDDFLPVEGMVDKALSLWQGIDDPQKICLSLYEPRNIACWTGVMPEDRGNVILSQWVDMCFLCEDRFFEALGEIKEVRYNWNIRTNIGSGVGNQISRTLFGKKYNLYNVKESLVVPQPEHFHSQMHK